MRLQYLTVNTKTFWFHLTAHTIKIILLNNFPGLLCPSFKKTDHIILDSYLQDNCSNMLPQSFTVKLSVCFLGKALFCLFRYFLSRISYTTANCLIQTHASKSGVRLHFISAARTDVISFLSPCCCFKNRTLKRKDVLYCMFPKGPHRLHRMPRQAPHIVKHRFLIVILIKEKLFKQNVETFLLLSLP